MQGLKITSKVLSFIIIINKIQWKIDLQNTSITLAPGIQTYRKPSASAAMPAGLPSTATDATHSPASVKARIRSGIKHATYSSLSGPTQSPRGL